MKSAVGCTLLLLLAAGIVKVDGRRRGGASARSYASASSEGGSAYAYSLVTSEAYAEAASAVAEVISEAVADSPIGDVDARADAKAEAIAEAYAEAFVGIIGKLKVKGTGSACVEGEGFANAHANTFADAIAVALSDAVSGIDFAEATAIAESFSKGIAKVSTSSWLSACQDEGDTTVEQTSFVYSLVNPIARALAIAFTKVNEGIATSISEAEAESTGEVETGVEQTFRMDGDSPSRIRRGTTANSFGSTPISVEVNTDG